MKVERFELLNIVSMILNPAVSGAVARQHTFVILEDASDGQRLRDATSGTLLGIAGSRFVVNGRAFSAVGNPVEDLPNYRSVDNYVTGTGNIADLFDATGLAVNEPFDAIDNTGFKHFSAADTDQDGVIDRASFHNTNLEDSAELQNRYNFRPFAVDAVDNTSRAPGFDGLLDPESTAMVPFQA